MHVLDAALYEDMSCIEQDSIESYCSLMYLMKLVVTT